MFLDDIGFYKDITKETSIPIAVFKKEPIFQFKIQNPILFKHRACDSKSGAIKKSKPCN